MKAQCPSCSTRFAVSEKMFGRKVKCACGQVIQIPAAKPSGSVPAATAPATPSDSTIPLTCSGCSKTLRVPSSAAGKVVKCSCGNKTRVPSPQVAPNVASNPLETPIAQPNSVNDPFAAQANPPSEADPLGIGNLQNYGTDIPTHHANAAPHAPQRAPGPRPKTKRISQQKPEKEGGVARLLGLGQLILGLVLFLAAGGLFYASFSAEQVKGRSYKGMIVLAIFGIGLMGSGANALFNTD